MAKLQRWVDLLAALLRRQLPVTLEELKRDVPEYLAQDDLAALRRMFERDKVELRAFGIPLHTVKDSNDEVMGYQLRREAFYLPYLTLVQDARPASKPRRVDRYGYRALPELAFEADELEAVVEAALRVQQLGDPTLAELARSAMRKLAFDLPVDATVREAAPVYFELASPASAMSDEEIFQALDEALRTQKRVSIEYESFASGEVREREVSPFGLFFLGSHWYLAAQEVAGGPVKNFRVSRIVEAKVNKVRPGTPDFAVPASFSLKSHAASRQAWELGDAGSIEAIVEFRGSSGATAAARRLGEAVPDEPSQRRFRVRRVDPFARWLLSFAGEVVPVSPVEVTEAYQDLAEDALVASKETA
jgi:proteasome accessory factor C